MDVVKELSLRMRGQKEVEKLLKVKRARKGKGTASQVIAEDSEEDEDNSDEDEVDDEVEIGGSQKIPAKGKGTGKANTELGDTWNALSDSSDSDTGSIASISQSQSQNKGTYQATASHSKKLKTVIEDSDWDDADIID